MIIISSTVHHCIILILLFLAVVTTVIEGPDVVIYRRNEAPVELVCNVTEGSILGWRVNGSTTAVIGDIARGLLADHIVNGNNLVIINATNNTNYICVGTTTDGLVDSDPVILYIASTYVRMLYYNVLVWSVISAKIIQYI